MILGNVAVLDADSIVDSAPDGDNRILQLNAVLALHSRNKFELWHG